MRCSLPTVVRWAGPRRPPCSSRRRARGARSTSSWPAWAARRSSAARRRRGRWSASAAIARCLPSRARARSSGPVSRPRAAPRACGAWSRPGGQLLLRGALAELLPPATLRAAHASPAPPPHAWSAWLDEALTPARIAAHGFFRREMVVRLLKEHRSGARDHTSRLWSIALVTRWLERQGLPVHAAERAAG